VHLEETGAAADTTLASDAFRLTGGADTADLYRRARAIVGRFRLGAVLLGAFLGLVVGFEIVSLAFPPALVEFEVDHAWCVSCGRCYLWCPRERSRRSERSRRRTLKVSGPPEGVLTPSEKTPSPWRTTALGLTLVTAIFAAGVAAGMVAIYAGQAKATILGQERLDALKARLVKDPADEALRTEIRREDLALRRSYFRDRQRLITGAWLLLAGAVALVLSARWTASFRRRGPRVDTVEARIPRPTRPETSRRSVFGVAGLWVATLAVLAALGAWPIHPLPAEVTAAETAFTQTWPRFRGPGGAGVAPDGDYPLIWDAASGRNILWTCPIPGAGNASPVVWGEYVYLTAADIERRTLSVICVERRTGTIAWQTNLTPAWDKWTEEERTNFLDEDLGYTGWAAPTAATDGERVVAAFATADIVCLKTDGAVLWQRNLGAPNNAYGLASSPIIHGDTVIWQVDQGNDADEGLSSLWAFNKRTGDDAWETPRAVPNSWTTPVMAETDGARELITSAKGWVIAYDPDSGLDLWRAKGVEGDVGPSPVVADGVVYVTTDGASCVAIRIGGSDDVTETHTLWRVDQTTAHSSSPVCQPGSPGRYLEAGNGLVLCRRADTGALLWEHDFDCDFSASPTLVGDLVYLPGADGKVYVFDLADAFQLRTANDLGEALNATPAFADSRIYVRGKTRLFCIGKRAP